MLIKQCISATIVFTYLVLCCFSVAFAASTSAVDGKKSTSFFVRSHTPPAGFESLNAAYTTIVEVYYQGKRIDEALVRYSPAENTIGFLEPAKLVAKLTDVLADKKPNLLKFLSGNLATHADLVCADKRPIPVCQISKFDQPAQLVFNESILRADIFLNPTLLKKSSAKQILLPSSTSAFSFADRLNTDISGSKTVDRHNNDYNIVNDGSLAYGNARVNYNVSYAETSSLSSNIADGQWRINRLNAEWDYKRFITQAGYINTFGNTFIGNQGMLGASFQTSLNRVNSKLNNIYGSSLIVFLNLPSQVSVYRDQQLLGSKFYPAGQQIIDTSGFPSGAYQVTLRIQDNLGNEREETLFFVSTQQIPPKDYPLYYARLGYFTNLPGSTAAANALLPKVNSVPVYQLGMERRLTDSWGLLIDALGSSDNAYLGNGVFFILPIYNIQVEPQFLIGIRDDYGVAINASATLGSLYFNVNATKLWAKDELSTATRDKFDPLAKPLTRFNTSVGFPIGNIRFRALTQWSKTDDNSVTYSYGLSSYATLMRKGGTVLSLDLSATRGSNDSLLALASFVLRLSTTHFNHDIRTGYQYDADAEKSTGNTFSAKTSWQQNKSTGYGWEIDAGVNKQLGQQGVNGGVNYAGRYADIAANVSYSGTSGNRIYRFDQRNSVLQYNANMRSNLIWVNRLMPYVGSGLSRRSGVIIYIHSDVPDQKFEVLDNNKSVGFVNTDTATPILLPGYQIHEISIRNKSQTFYDYDQTDKAVILFPGNYQHLQWNATELLLIETEIKTPGGKPLAEAKQDQASGYNYTDTNGYIQLEVTRSTHSIKFIQQDGTTCQVHLPKQMKSEAGFVSLDALICYPESQ